MILGKKKYLKDLSIEVYGSMISAALIAISFFVFSDFFFEPPNLNGKWFTVIKTENSSLDRFVGMMLIYEIILFQDDDNLYGTAEKISEIVNLFLVVLFICPDFSFPSFPDFIRNSRTIQ